MEDPHVFESCGDWTTEKNPCLLRLATKPGDNIDELKFCRLITVKFNPFFFFNFFPLAETLSWRRL